jgi:hypothetical protein
VVAQRRVHEMIRCLTGIVEIIDVKALDVFNGYDCLVRIESAE